MKLTKENKKTISGLFKGLLGLAVAVAPNLSAQDDEEVFELSPFSIQADDTEGYSATSTLAGTRLKTDLRDLGAAISVLTPQMFEDTGATDAESVLAYGLNTEISGANGNFANSTLVAGVSDTTSSRREPHKANRVRGLAEATLTRGQFVTDIPFDAYNTSRVTINRGPNSLLFGIGSPGGVIDNSLITASRSKDFGEVSLRFGERGSNRQTVDYNKALFNDRLGLRFSAMREDTEYQQRPAFKNEKRYFLALEALLFKNENSSFLGETILRGNMENGESSGTPVNVVPPADAFKSWFQNSHYNRGQEQYTGVTLPGWVDDGSFVPRRTIDNFGLPASLGGTVPGSARTNLGGFSFQTLWDWVPLNFSSPTADTPNNGLSGAYSDIAGVLGRWRAQGPATADNPQVEQWSNWPLELLGTVLPGFNVPVVDPQVVDNKNMLLSGTTSSVDRDFDTNSLVLEQSFLDGKAGLELSYDKQDYTVVDQFPFTNQRWNMVWIDINETLSNGLPNPNVGRPMMMANRFFGIPEDTRKTERESARATAFYELDFTENDGASSWLGKHTFTGLMQSDTVDNTFLNTRLKWAPYQTYSDLHNGVTYNSNWAPWPVWYVGPDLRNTANYLDVRLDQPITGRVPQAGDSFNVITTKRIGPDYTTNPDGTRGDIYNLQVDRVAHTGNRTQRKIDSEAFSWQSYFLDGNLTGLMGWRTDETYSFDRAGAARNSDGSWAAANQQLGSTPNPTVSGSTFTWGAVAHFPEDRLFELPGGADLSFHYNESENFSPIVGRSNFRGEQLPAPTGSTQDYGFLLELMERKLSIRVNWFELSSQFASFKAPFQGNTGNAPQVYQDGYRDAKLSGADFDEFINNPVHPAEASDWFSSWDDLSDAVGRARPDYYAALINPRFEPADSGNLVWDSIPGLTQTTDFVSEGIEIDISGQLTQAWRMTLNVGQQQTIQTNTARDAIALYNDTVAGLKRENLWPIIFSPLGQDVAVLEHYGRIGADVARAQAQDGSVSQELREWRINLITNYTFQEAFLKGFSVGGAVRWQDDIAIGYPTSLNSEGTQLPILDSPYYGPTQLNGDLWFSYRRKIWKDIDWKIQLNVRNAIGDDDYIPIVANPDGRIASFRNPNPKEFFLTNTFSF